jgi:hypothetical protein
MGDRSPKSTQRAKDQKNAVKTQTKNEKDKRQQGFASVLAKGTKK